MKTYTHNQMKLHAELKGHYGFLKCLVGWFFLDAFFSLCGFVWDIFKGCGAKGCGTGITVVTGVEILLALLRLFFIYKVYQDYRLVRNDATYGAQWKRQIGFHVSFLLTWVLFYYLVFNRPDTLHSVTMKKWFWAMFAVDWIIWGKLCHSLSEMKKVFTRYAALDECKDNEYPYPHYDTYSC